MRGIIGAQMPGIGPFGPVINLTARLLKNLHDPTIASRSRPDAGVETLDHEEPAMYSIKSSSPPSCCPPASRLPPRPLRP